MSRQRADQLVEAGLWLKLSGDTEGAKRLFEQALRLDPENPRAKQLIDARLAPPVPDPNPPGSPAPPSNAPGQSRSLVEQDWAMATGILVERGVTPPPVTPVPRAQVPDTPWTAPPADPLQNTKPWASDEASGNRPSTLIMGQPVAPPSEEGTNPFGQRPQVSGHTPTPSATQVFGQVPVPPHLKSRDSSPKAPVKVESAWDRGAAVPEPVSSAAEMGRAMDLVSTPVPTFTPPPGSLSKRVIEDEVRTLLKGAKDLLDLDDHTGAIDLILKAQELAPLDPDVARMRERSEQTLQAMFESKLGSMEKRPRVVLKDDEIIWLNLDHRAGFVLAQIDGTVSFEDLFAVSGMSRLDTARILAQLMDEGVIKA